MSHVVVAPDKFKGTLTAAQVAAHVAAGLGRACPGVKTVQVPVADGGDGTVDAAEAAGYRRVDIGVRGPTGKPVDASFALLDGTAIIESAQACGLTRLPGGTPAPLTATSRGVGELILAAVRMRAKRIVLGLGGSACTDGGAGLVTALGGRLLDASGTQLAPGGGALARLDHIDVSRLRDVSGSGTEFIMATDVDNPLLGPRGAAAVYAPQKGASAQDVTLLEEGLARWADVTERSFGFVKRDEPGAGAAGGLGFAALGFLRAAVQPGIELMLDLLGFAGRLSGARLVVTGEGSLDEQTLHGKAPAGVARAAAAAAPDLPVVAVAGVCSLSPDQLRSAGIARAYALADIEPDLTRCLDQPGPLLEELAGHIARDWLTPLRSRRPCVSPSTTTMSLRDGHNHVNATWVGLFWSELPADDGRAGRRRSRARPRPARRSRQPLPPHRRGAGDGAVTGTMPHRPGPDRDSVTSSRSRAAASRARRGTPERQVTPGTQEAPRHAHSEGATPMPHRDGWAPWVADAAVIGVANELHCALSGRCWRG